ncbi:hypothetical protein JW826_01025 [Candidatus Woesearchaeota archaeon]|nr:hypothetical protein [Candidatus Woesearchaeota archaeon]
MRKRGTTMPIQKRTKGRFTIYDVKKGTAEPVSEVIAMLRGEPAPRHDDQIMVDLTSMKPSKLTGIHTLITDMPYQGKVNKVVFAVPDSLVDETNKAARQHTESTPYYVPGNPEHARPTYLVVNKTQATVMASLA